MKRRNFILGTAFFASGVSAASLYWGRRWNYIVVHHSAGNFGTIEFLQEVHRDRQAGDPLDAIPYHYVIGNGNGLGMGEVASDWRLERNIWGTHVSANNKARNFLGLGICLVGNFEEAQVPEAQFAALVTLTRSLMLRHGISASDVGFHGDIHGESTKCPGQHFPRERLRAAIS